MISFVPLPTYPRLFLPPNPHFMFSLEKRTLKTEKAKNEPPPQKKIKIRQTTVRQKKKKAKTRNPARLSPTNNMEFILFAN